MKHLMTVATVLCLLALGACGQQRPAAPGRNAGYDRLLRTLYRETVPLVQPAALAASLQQAPDSVTVLDARTPAEYRVSHLAGARFVDFATFEQNTFAGLPRNRPVVVYCAVGYRSERVGERLLALGFRDVRNLYGGIFQWVNEGRPVVNAQGPTADVHPYSALWRPWLTRGRPVYR